jgi:hypothetical protein
MPSDYALSGLVCVAWPCIIGLHPILVYFTPSGLSACLGFSAGGKKDPFLTWCGKSKRALNDFSPEGVKYTNDGCSPSSLRQGSNSPERAKYDNDAGFSAWQHTCHRAAVVCDAHIGARVVPGATNIQPRCG